MLLIDVNAILRYMLNDKCPNVKTESKEVLILALKTFADVNMDFVDCILHGLKVIYDHDVFTFDKLLNSVIHKL